MRCSERCLLALAAICTLAMMVAAESGVAQSQVDSALEDCKRSLEISPDTAIRACTDVLRRYPRAAAAYVRRGHAHCVKNDYDSAIADFSGVVKAAAGAKA